MASSGSYGDGMRANAAHWAALAAASRNQNTLSLAKSLLASTNFETGQSGKVTTTISEGSNQESPFGRIIDLLTTPLAGVAGAVSGVATLGREIQSGQFDPGDLLEPMKQSAEGVAGNLYSVATGDPNIAGKKSMGQVVQDAYDSKGAQDAGLQANQIEEFRQKYESYDPSLLAKVATFGLDIAGDPLTYVGGLGLGVKSAKFGLQGAEAALKATEEAGLAAKTGEKIISEANAITSPLSDAKLTPYFRPGDNGQGSLFSDKAFRTEAPAPVRQFGEEIPAADYQLPGQMEIKNSELTGISAVEPKPTYPVRFGQGETGQGALFGADPLRGGKAGGSPAAARRGMAERGVDTPVANEAIDQSALFNFNPNPKVDGLVPNIAAYPGKVKPKAAEELVAPVAKVVETPAIAESTLKPVQEAVKAVTKSTAEGNKIRKLASIDRFVKESGPAKVVTKSSKAMNPNVAAMKIITEDIGVRLDAINPGQVLDTKIPVEFPGSDKPVREFTIGQIGRALVTGDGTPFTGALFGNAEGTKFVTFDKLIAKFNKHIAAPAESAPATGVTVQTTNPVFLAAARAVGLNEKEIAVVLKAKDPSKALDNIATAKEAKASSSAKTQADIAPTPEAPKTEIPASSTAPEPTVVPEPTPIPEERLTEGLAKQQEQSAIASQAIQELAGTHPKILERTVSLTRKRAESIKNNPRSRPNKEEEAKQLEALGKTQSVQNKARGVVRANPLEQYRTFQDILKDDNLFKLWTPKKGQKLTPEIHMQRAEIAFKALKVAEEELLSLGTPPLTFVGRNATFRLSDFIQATANDVGISAEELIVRMGWLRGARRAPADQALYDTIETALTQGYNNGLHAMAAEFPSVDNYLKTGDAVQAVVDAKVVKQVQAEVSDLMSLKEATSGTKMVSEAEKTEAALNYTPKITEELTAELGGSDAAADLVKTNVQKELLGVPDNVAPAAVDSVAATTTKKAMKGDPTVDQHGTTLKKIDEEILGPSPTIEQRNDNLWTRFMNGMCAWYGYKNLYHLHQQKVLGATALTHLIETTYIRTIKELGLTEAAHAKPAWQYINGSLDISSATAQEKAIYDLVTNRLKNTVRDWEVGTEYRVGTSVFTRSGLTMDEINAELRNVGLVDFKFHVPETGASGNNTWMESWKTYNGADDPLTFAAKIEAATNRAAYHKMMVSDLRYNFHTPNGVPIDPKLFPELAGARFDPEIAKQIPILFGKWDEMMNSSSKFAKGVDIFHASWKTGVTIYSPSHHVRNLNGDLFFAWLAGVNIGNPRLIRKMNDVMRAKSEFYKDLKPDANVTELITAMRNGHATEAAILNRPVAPTKVLSRFVSRKGKAVEITADDFWKAATDRGVLRHSLLVEDIPGRSLMGVLAEKGPVIKKIVQPTGGRAQKFARGVSEGREHGVRILHFIDATEKAVKRNLARGMDSERALRLAFDEAAEKVAKWHPDGTGLSQFEKNYMRRIFPFYSWTRKAIPLMMEATLTNPAKMTLYPKFMHDVIGSDDQQDLANPWPADQMFPRWLREMPIGPMQPALNFMGNQDDATIGQIPGGNPYMDFGNQFVNDPKSGVLSMLTPLARVPAEMIFKQDSQTGAPIKDTGAYLDKQIPPLAILNRMGNTDIGFGSVGSVLTGGPIAPLNNTGRATNDYVNNNNIANFLAALGLINAEQPNYVKQAQYEEKDRRAAQAKAMREAAQQQ